MSDSIKHECGVALVRLLKPLEYYIEKYGSWTYGLQRLYLLMEKQHNRGQDGAGVATLKLNPAYGHPYIDRSRSDSKYPIRSVFDEINSKIAKAQTSNDINFIRENVPFAGEIYLGHLKYATRGQRALTYVHPVMRFSNWKSRNLVLAGNFSLTNANEIFEQLVESGQHPRDFSDTVTVLEKFGFYLDMEYDNSVRKYMESENDLSKACLKADNNLALKSILYEATKRFDGGYTIAGMVGNGDTFALRDPNGIRPAFYYADDEIVVIASERPAIQTAFKLDTDQIKEIEPGHAIIVKANGKVYNEEIRPEAKRTPCSFERIYFSRGTDKDIYEERKQLGVILTPDILKSINGDIENTVFSYIPNTAETSYYGMMEGLNAYLRGEKKRLLLESKGNLSEEEISKIIALEPRSEKIAVKDVKMRTFITEGEARTDMVEHVYDVTYGIVNAGKDNLVIIDDSIVRGTTLKNSILRMMDRLKPKKVVVVSSAPQVRFPDCYGIDMSRMEEFCAFLAVIELYRDNNKMNELKDLYNKCKAQQTYRKEDIVNYVKDVYNPFSVVEISKKIAEMLRPEDMVAEVELVYQTVEGLHKACKNHKGDWYFTGDYPTPGGNKVLNTAYINYYEKFILKK